MILSVATCLFLIGSDGTTHKCTPASDGDSLPPRPAVCSDSISTGDHRRDRGLFTRRQGCICCVCPYLRRPCQKLLYTEITLRWNARVRRLDLLIKHNPRLANYIRILTLLTSGLQLWKCKALRTVLKKLTHLRSLSITSTPHLLNWSKKVPKSSQAV